MIMMGKSMKIAKFVELLWKFIASSIMIIKGG